MIMGTEGGIRMPRVPPAAMEPMMSGRPYPRRSISGMAIIPMVAAVATLEPDTAAKMAHEKMLATASPPGRKPTQRATAVKRPLPMPEWSRIPLMKTKRGTAMKEKLVALVQAIDPTTPMPTFQPLR